jgi:alginate O-acetyltransferase complex protein AlgJ
MYVVAFLGLLSAPLLATYRLKDSHPCHPSTLLKTKKWKGRLGACRDNFNQQFVIGPHIHSERLCWLYRLFGISGVPEVVAGKGDWLYLYGGGYPNIRSIAREPFGPSELGAWIETLAAWYAYLSEKGIHFIFVVAPDKHTIYPEKLPWYLQQSVPQPSRVDTLIEALHADPRTRNLAVVDPRQALLQQKGDAELFYRSDTHWNLRGALVGYQDIVSKLGPWYPQLVPLKATDFDMHCEDAPGGDLARMLKLSQKDRFQNCELVWPEGFTGEHGHPLQYQMAWDKTPSNANLPTRPIRNLLVWGDSFSVGLLPFLLAHASEARVLRSAGLMDTDDLAQQQPDLVIMERVERHLYAKAPPPPQAFRGFSFGEGFYQEPVASLPKERWMSQDAVLRLDGGHVQKHRSLNLSFRIPAEVAAAGPLTYTLGNQVPIHVPQTGLRASLEIAREDWPNDGGGYTIKLHGMKTMVPALACGRFDDVRDLTAAVEVVWRD